MVGEKPREIAARILAARDQGAFVEARLDDALQRAEFKPEDRRLLQELVCGVVRWRLTLDWLIARKTGGKAQKPLVQDLLRLALYQMFWLDRVPSYAAVSESVGIAKRRGLVSEARFINAVLRACGREEDQIRAQLRAFRKDNLPLGYSHPDWLCRRWEQRWGRDKAIRLLEWNNIPPCTYARVNTLKATPAEVRNAWSGEGVEAAETAFPWVPSGLIYQIVKHPPLAALPSFQQGLFYIQDPSTLLAVGLLGPQPGDTILDLCAAPGGKTTAIAQFLGNQGRILAADPDPSRLDLLSANCGRLGVTCVSTVPQEVPGPFDRILVDAPCSNTGVMRRRVELRWRVTPGEIDRLARHQLQILETAAGRLKPGGTLLYSTCSLEGEENQGVVRAFLDANRSFRLETEQEVHPAENGADGAYCARLIAQT